MSISDRVDDVNIRDVFQECYSTIRDLIVNRKPGKKLTNAFCGMGKSSLIYKTVLTCVKEKVDLNLVVAPSIPLITQFNREYMSRVNGANLFNQLNVCSRNEIDEKEFGQFDFTTDPTAIKLFLTRMTGAKVVCCTYQSLQNFISCMPEGMKVDVVQFDEAHHTSSKLQKYCIFSEPFYNLGLFYTATPCPKIEHEIAHKRMERICFAPYWVGVEKGYLKNIEVRIDINKKKPIRETRKGRNTKLYQSISRAILSTGNNKVMSFHRFVNGQKKFPGITSVNGFYDPQSFKNVFESIQRTEFPHLANKYKEIRMFKCTADDTKKIKKINSEENSEEKSQRDIIVDEFQETPDDVVCLLASCATIGEGVDTKNANMCVFADPKGSWMTIIQNIGRIVRISDRCKNFVGTVLIPILIDQEPYKECKDNVERDEYLREQLNRNQDYSMIMNVLSALKQSNEDDFDLCLFYPKNKKTTLPPSQTNTSGGTNTSSEASAETKTETETSAETSSETKTETDTSSEASAETKTETSPETSAETKTDTDTNTSPETSPETKTETSAETKTNTGGSSDTGGRPKPTIKIKMNKEFRVLWGIKDNQDDQFLENAITSAVIDCAIERDKSLDDKWEENMQRVLEYKDNTGGIPAVRDGENFGIFLNTQKYIYRNFKKNLKGPKMPESRVDKFEEYCKELEIDLDEYLKEENVRKSFEERKQECIEMMKKLKGKKPNSRSKDPKESTIGRWIGAQLLKFDKLKPEERKFIEQFKSQDKEDKWEKQMQQLVEYKKKKGGLPSLKENNYARTFLNSQKCKYKSFKKNLKFEKMPESRVVKFEEYCKELEIDLDEYLNEEKTEGKYKCVCGSFMTNYPSVIESHKKSKKHIDYITKNKPEPKVENPSREYLKEEKTEGKYKCVCGSLIVNTTSKINQHKKTKKHIDYITKNKPEPKVENPSREYLNEEKTEGKYKCVCGSFMTNYPSVINQHKKSKKHINYITKNKPEPKVENPSREYLIDQIRSITNTNNSYTDWSEDELNSRLEALELEDW